MNAAKAAKTKKNYVSVGLVQEKVLTSTKISTPIHLYSGELLAWVTAANDEHWSLHRICRLGKRAATASRHNREKHVYAMARCLMTESAS